MLRLKLLSESILRRPEGEAGADAPPNQDALREVMIFDPFTPPAKEGADGGGGEEPEETPAQGGEARTASGEAPPASSSEPPAPAKKEGEEDDPLAELRKTVQSFLAKAPEPAKEAPKEPAAPAAGTETKEEPKGYELTVPDEVAEAFASEDPKVRKAAISATISAVANRLVKDFTGALVQLRKEVLEEAVRASLGQVEQRSSIQRVKDDFYGNFPALKQVVDQNPAFENAIWETIGNAGQKLGVKDWNADFRDQMGMLIHLNLGIPVPQEKLKRTAPAGNGGTPQKAPRKAPFSAGGSSGGRSNGADDDPQGFMDVLNASG